MKNNTNLPKKYESQKKLAIEQLAQIKPPTLEEVANKTGVTLDIVKKWNSDSEFINVTNVVDVARTMNKRFLTKQWIHYQGELLFYSFLGVPPKIFLYFKKVCDTYKWLIWFRPNNK